MRQFSKPLNCHLENKHRQIYISKKIRVNVENNVNNNTKPVPICPLYQWGKDDENVGNA